MKRFFSFVLLLMGLAAAVGVAWPTTSGRHRRAAAMHCVEEHALPPFKRVASKASRM